MKVDGPNVPTVASIFGPSIAVAVKALSLDQAKYAAIRRIEDLIDPECEECLASAVMFAKDPANAFAEDPATNFPAGISHAVISPSRPKIIIDSYAPWNPAEAIMIASGNQTDDRPCKLCEDAQRQDNMILCDRCNDCYHRDCACSSKGS
jgi:hypothetical protein